MGTGISLVYTAHCAYLVCKVWRLKCVFCIHVLEYVAMVLQFFEGNSLNGDDVSKYYTITLYSDIV